MLGKLGIVLVLVASGVGCGAAPTRHEPREHFTRDDGDKIPRSLDQCPDAPEDEDRFEDADGCPDLDNDQDGILDERDLCPNEAEDLDSFEDADGCPEPDNDHDRIADAFDACPLDAEVYNGIEDDDGCPDKPVEVPCPTASYLVILDRIDFSASSLTIATPPVVLDAVAQTILGNSFIEKLVVVGGASSKENDPVAISQERAAAVVQALVDRKVPVDRISPRGLGTAAAGSPVMTHGRSVWFVIRRISGKEVNGDSVSELMPFVDPCARS